MLSNIQAKLLIVDDLPENLLALEALIKREDRMVYKALSADEALSLLLQHEFAMAILDVQMPGMNGFELAELMRGTEKTKNIPIVFVSAAGRELNYAFKGYESGAVDFLHKPLDIHAVKSKVNVFVDLYRQSKAMKQQVEELEQARREQEALLKQLQTTQNELEQAVRMRDDFMSIVAHEVRTPLNGLILETQLRKMHLARDNASAFTLDKMHAIVSLKTCWMCHASAPASCRSARPDLTSCSWSATCCKTSRRKLTPPSVPLRLPPSSQWSATGTNFVSNK